MVKILLKNTIDPYQNLASYKHSDPVKIFYKKRMWSVVKHEEKAKVSKGASFIKAFLSTLFTLGIGPLISSKVRGWWEAFLTGKNVKEVYVLFQTDWNQVVKFSRRLKNDSENPRILRLFKEQCKGSCYNQILIADSRATGADVLFNNHDGHFYAGDLDTCKNGNSLLIMIAKDEGASTRLTNSGYMDFLTKEAGFVHPTNSTFVMTYKDFQNLLCGRLPTDLVRLVQGKDARVNTLRNKMI